MNYATLRGPFLNQRSSFQITETEDNPSCLYSHDSINIYYEIYLHQIISLLSQTHLVFFHNQIPTAVVSTLSSLL